MSRRKTVGMCALVAVGATVAGFFAAAFMVAVLDGGIPSRNRESEGVTPRRLEGRPEQTTPAVIGPAVRYASNVVVPIVPLPLRPLPETPAVSRS